MTTKRWLALLVTLLLVAASCGGDDETSTDTTAGGDTSSTDEGGGDGDAFTVDTEECEDPDAANAPIEGEIVIGTSIPQTGGPAVLFKPFGDGFTARFDALNDAGGINGQKVKVVLKDDQYTDTKTVANVNEIIDNDDPAAFAGIIGTPNNAAVREDLNALCIPQLFNATGAPDWGDLENFPWTIGGLVPYNVEARVFAQFAGEQLPDGGKAALFYVNSDFGKAYVDPFKEAADEAGFELVAEETIAADDNAAPSSQMTNIVSSKPDIILAAPLGAQCISFMGELGKAKAANADFDPIVYLTATCANKVFFGAAQQGAEGVYTSANIKDVNNPDVAANDEDVKTYIDAIKAISSEIDPGGIAGAGWVIADITVHVLEEAAKSDDGLTRASILNAARNLDYTPPLLREGLTLKTNAEDGYIAEGTQILQWSAADQGFKDVGEVINLEGTTKFEE